MLLGEAAEAAVAEQCFECFRDPNVELPEGLAASEPVPPLVEWPVARIAEGLLHYLARCVVPGNPYLHQIGDGESGRVGRPFQWFGCLLGPLRRR